ncbi:hypothetical protein WMF43_06435 [Sorangium sp. So ce131]
MQLALSASLLRRHVRRRSQHVAMPGELRVRFVRQGLRRPLVPHVARTHAPAEAPVHHQRLAQLADHEVVGLEITVDDAAAVRVGHRLADAREGVDEAAEGPARGRLPEALWPRSGVDFVDDVAERAAADLAHREPEATVLEPAAVVDRDDAGVLEAPRELGLGEEAHLDLLGVGDVGAEQLHRHDAIELEVVDASDLAEATRGDATLVAVARWQTRHAERSRVDGRLGGRGHGLAPRLCTEIDHPAFLRSRSAGGAPGGRSVGQGNVRTTKLGTLDRMLGWMDAVWAASIVDRRMGTGRIRLGVERVDVRRM